MTNVSQGTGDDIRGRRVPAGRSARGVFLFYALLAIAASGLLALSGRGALGLRIGLWTVPVIALVGIFTIRRIELVRDPRGSPAPSFGAPNALTVLRLILVPPTLVLLFDGALLAGSLLYVVAALTDVADGAIARRSGRVTRYGLLIDPVGDIVSTFGVFVFLFARGAVPFWLFLLLALRYTEFFAGLWLLRRLGSLPRLEASIAGKAAGVVQAIGIVLFLTGMTFSGVPVDRLQPVLVPVLGVAFGAVIVSQTIIGARALGGRGGV